MHIKQLLLFSLAAAPLSPTFLYAATCDPVACTFEATYTEPTRLEPVPPSTIGTPLADLKHTTIYMQADPIHGITQPIITHVTPATAPTGGGTVTVITPPYPIAPGTTATLRFRATATNNFGEGQPTRAQLTVDRSQACPPQPVADFQVQ